MFDISDENSVQRTDRAGERNDNNPMPDKRIELLLHPYDTHVRENTPFGFLLKLPTPHFLLY